MTPSRTAPLQELLAALEALGPRPALVWHGDEGRVELSGHVLANWIIKSVNHLAEEIALGPGDRVVLALDPHWKRLVIAIAAWGLGGEVVIGEHGAAADPLDATVADPAHLLVASDPGQLGQQQVDAAEETMLLELRSLSRRHPSPLPALAHDWVSEVRACADALTVPLGYWSGPAAEDPGTRLLVEADGLAAPGATLGALQSGRGIVGPRAAISAAQADAEGARPLG
ncbi:hypothetical protein Bequi_11300 [Brachybacterium sp. JHP9]|uniref:TIGR03089 family protein n=1 Tax=Brachybacterium equifaecis TaxID=2910770 RepID=A0ABT0R221_9MICO|nr:TIGR03089 family protein [Brachybacterium equifaecis]MCL6423957.1 hypothetical protein [Brachybacterium equifaecis]